MSFFTAGHLSAFKGSHYKGLLETIQDQEKGYSDLLDYGILSSWITL